MSKEFFQNIVSQRFVKAYHEIKTREDFTTLINFARRMDYQRQGLYQILSGKRDVPFSLLNKFISEYNLDANQFFGKEREYIKHIPAKDHSKYYDNKDREAYLLSLSNIPIENYFSQNDIISFEVKDNALAPFILKSDWLMCQRLPVKTILEVNKVYVFVTSKGININRVLGINKKQKSYTLSNKNNEAYLLTVLEKDITEVWEIEKILKDTESLNYSLENRLSILEDVIYNYKSSG